MMTAATTNSGPHVISYLERIFKIMNKVQTMKIEDVDVENEQNDFEESFVDNLSQVCSNILYDMQWAVEEYVLMRCAVASRRDYQDYGDVAVFDNPFKMNIYVEGFEQVGEGSEGDDDDPDLDIGDDDKLGDDFDQNSKDYMEGDVDEPIDELDKANFSNGKPSGSGSKAGGACVSAAKFHPMMLSDEVHEQFIEKIEIKTPSAHVGDFRESAEIIPIQEDMDICLHTEYVSAQLRKFENG
ncbi:hypothetical protein D1007_04757 [Hordeum vulgare]|nr:hypothetical protein D1007_04757 [Hordeum vulgare]